MTQLQINIEFTNGKLKIVLSNFKRDDAKKEEIEFTLIFESVIKNAFVAIAKEGSLHVRERKVGA